MSKNRLLRLLPVLLAILLVFSVSVFAPFAEPDDTSSETTASEVTSSEETASDASSDTASSEATTTEETSSEATSSEATSSEATSSEAASEGTSTEATSDEGTSSEAVSDAESDAAEEETGSNIPWKLIISLIVIVVIVAVLFILAKTNSKLGQRIAKFFKDYKSEISKISWMPRNELVRSTLVVLAVIVASAVAIGLLDFLFSTLVKLLSFGN